MLPRAHVGPPSGITSFTCTNRLTPAQSYQRQSSAAGEHINCERSELPKIARRLQRFVRWLATRSSAGDRQYAVPSLARPDPGRANARLTT